MLHICLYANVGYGLYVTNASLSAQLNAAKWWKVDIGSDSGTFTFKTYSIRVSNSFCKPLNKRSHIYHLYKG